MKISYYFLFLFSFNCLATKMSYLKVQDPILENESCEIGEVMSMGGYIYQWPSKYDLVFWPESSIEGFSICTKSGFSAFNNDFEELTKEEKISISNYLKKINFGKSLKNSFDCIYNEVQFQHLEKIYSFRNETPAFENKLKRILAYLYESIGEFENANKYRMSALKQIPTLLNGDIDYKDKLTFLFLGFSYSKQLNQTEKSDKYLSLLNSELSKKTIEEMDGYKAYISDLIESSRKITPYGRLNPEKANAPLFEINNKKLSDNALPLECKVHVEESQVEFSNHLKLIKKDEIREQLKFRKKLFESGNKELLQEYDNKFTLMNFQYHLVDIEATKSNLRLLKEIKSNIKNIPLSASCYILNPILEQLEEKIKVASGKQVE